MEVETLHDVSEAITINRRRKFYDKIMKSQTSGYAQGSEVEIGELSPAFTDQTGAIKLEVMQKQSSARR